MALLLPAGRITMFSFCWRDFKDVEYFLAMFLFGGFALRMIELRSVLMVSASSVSFVLMLSYFGDQIYCW